MTRDPRLLLILALFGAFLSSLTGCTGQPQPAAPSSTASRRIPVKAVAVEQVKVARTSTQPATVIAFFEAEIRPRITGYVRSIHADLGDYVEAGAVLSEIDVPDVGKQLEVIESRIARLRAEEQRANAGVELSHANVQSANAALEQSRSLLAQADARLAASEAEFHRVNELVERRSLEGRLLDETRKKRDSDQAARAAALSAIRSAEAEVAVARARQLTAEADLSIARAEIGISQKQLEELQVQLSFSSVRAPFAGVVTDRQVDPGDLVRESESPALFVISQIDKVRIQIPVPEADAAAINPGDEITVMFPSFPGELIQTSVTRLSQRLDASTRTMLVEADYDNSQRKLLPGMFGQATISLTSKAVANMLPARAIRFDENGRAFVYVLSDSDEVAIRKVTTGLDEGTRIEVIEGLGPGDRVVDAHLSRFTEGQPVQVIETK